MTAPLRRAAQAWATALVLFVLALAPGLDGVVCGGEGAHAQPPTATAAVAALSHDALSHDAAPADGHADDGACAHGHCHHAAPAQAQAATALSEPARVVAILTPASSRPLTSGLADPLERPPRA